MEAEHVTFYGTGDSIAEPSGVYCCCFEVIEMWHGNTDPFYLSKEWRKLRKDVLRKYKGECQVHKARGQYRKATHIHHEFHRDRYPEYELMEYVTLSDGSVKRNLVPVCKDCHETVCHPERLRWNKKKSLTEERW